MAGREAKLTLRLVDRVTGPARAIRTALGETRAALGNISSTVMAPARVVGGAARQMQRSARDAGVASLGIGLGATRAAQQVYRMQDTLNEIEGRRFGKGNTFTLANGVEITREQFRQSVVDLVDEVARTTPRAIDEIARAVNQLVQAGLSHEQVEAILPTAIDFAIAGNYETEEAADALTNVMTSMRLPMALQQEAEKSALRAADVIAYAANETNSDVRQMTEAFKYAAPSASALGISIEQLAAMFLIQARRGIKASEAGVSIRAMMTRMVRPTNMAQAALARYGIDLADYLETTREISAQDFTTSLGFGGLDASGAAGEIQSILDSTASTGEKVKEITAAIMASVGDQTTMSAQAISDSVGEILFGFGEELDVERLIADMQAAGIAMADFFRIFDVRQGARTLALFSDDFSAWTRDIESNAEGFAEALRETRMQGIVGSWQRLAAGIRSVTQAVADSGVMKTAERVGDWLYSMSDRLKTLNPRVLELGTYGLLTFAALAPLGFALSGVGSALAMLVNPLTAVVGGLTYLAWRNWDGIATFFREFGSAITENISPEVLDTARRLGDYVRNLFHAADSFLADGERVAASARSIGATIATAINRIHDAFVAMSNLTGIDLSVLGTVAGWGLTLGLGAIGITAAAGAIVKLTNALLLLSGAKLAWGALKFVGRLAGIGKKAAGVTAAASAVGGAATGRAAVAGAAGASAGARGLMGPAGWAMVAGLIAKRIGEYSMNFHGRGVGSPGYEQRIDAGMAQQKISELEGSLNDATESWPQAAYRAMLNYVDALAAGGDSAEAEAASIGAAIEQELSVTGHPDVNTARLQHALGLARELAGTMRSLNGGSVGAPAPSEGKLPGRASGGPVRRGLTYEINERGRETVTMGTNGYVTPAHRGGQGGGIQIGQLTIQGGNAEETMAKLERVLNRALDRSRQVAIDGRAIG